MTAWDGRAGQAKLVKSRGSRARRGFCRPLPYHLGTAPLLHTLAFRLEKVHRRRAGWEQRKLERETGFEPATSTLARSHSTTELLPLDRKIIPHLRFPPPVTAGEA